MRHRLQSIAGRVLHHLRQQTVEQVMEILNSVLGFQRFRLPGRPNVAVEWTLVCLVYKPKRLPRLSAGLELARPN